MHINFFLSQLMMEGIYSERELMPPGKAWGQWEFSMSSQKLTEKLASFPKPKSKPNENNERWMKLFSATKPITIAEVDQLSTGTNENSVTVLDDETNVESATDENQLGMKNESVTLDSGIEDFTTCLVEMSNLHASKLRSDFDSVKKEMDSLTQDLVKFEEGALSLIFQNAWSELHSDMSKMCLCVPCFSDPRILKSLCQNFLLPWLSKTLPSKLEHLSFILSSTDWETVCQHLLVPVLQIEGSPIVKDVLNLEDLMSSMKKKQWTTLLRGLLSTNVDINNWNSAVFATIVENSEPSYEDLCIVVKEMSSTETSVAQSRDFGTLLVAVVNALKPGFDSLTSQLNLIANNYKGPLKYKALKVLADFKGS